MGRSRGTTEPGDDGPAKRGMSWASRSGRKPLVALVLVVLAAATGALLAGAGPASSTTVPPSFFVVTDQQGANDEPNQKDLTQMGRDDTNPAVYNLFWSWDDVDFTGQAGDACALFDYNGNGNVDVAVCSQIHNDASWTSASPVITQTVAPPNGKDSFQGGPPYVFTCSDATNDRCSNPSDAKSYSPSDIQAGVLGSMAASPPGNLVTDTDPFAAGDFNPNDSTLQINIQKTYLAGLMAGTAALVNVCSFPSAANGGNNSPGDCIVNGGGGYLKIVKNAAGADASTTDFTFAVDPGSIGKTITGSGDTGAFAVSPFGSEYSVAETAPSNWSLVSAACTFEGGGSANTGQDGSTLTGVAVQSGKITTCTFNNAEAQEGAALSLTKADNLNPGKYDHVGQVVTYTLTAKNTGTATLHDVSVSDSPALADFTCTPSIPAEDLAPDATIVCTGTHTITQGDLTAGSFADTASATSTEADAPDATDTVFAAPPPSSPPPSSPPPTPPLTPPVVPTPPAPKIDLQITKADSPDPDVLGTQVRYLIVVKNNGPDTAHNVQMSDPIPFQVTFSSVSTTQGTCTGGQLVSCQLGTIASGASVTVTLFVKTTVTGIVTNTATTVGTEVETNTANNTASTTTLVKGPFKPPVVQTGCYAVAVSPHSLSAGKRATLVLSVHMLGKPAKNARVRVAGAGISKTSGPTNAKGIVRISLKPAKPGILRFQPVAHKGCGVPRIGVIGAFTPPVTG